MGHYLDIRAVEIIAPNFKRRLSGVTSTIVQLIPLQRAKGHAIATLGPGLPAALPRIRFLDILRLWSRPASGASCRIWHARRNNEMLAGWLMRSFLRMPVKLVFTSAAQRNHTRWSRFLIDRMDAIIATSARSASFLKRPATIIMHGVDTRRFAPPEQESRAKQAIGQAPDQLLVGCFGRIRHQKGTDLFVDAMIALLPEHPRWRAVICGRANAEHRAFEEELKTRIARNGLSDRIAFMGEVLDILPWYQAIDLYVAPSRNEGFGLTPLEAMACGVPVIASDAGAYAEMIVPAVTGEVVPAGDGEGLRNAIASWIDKADGKANEHALAHVRTHFPLEREADAIASIYHRLLGRGGSA
jgi:mannosyltransferase